MTFIFLVPLSIALGLVGLAAFLWALNNGQFEDADGAAWRIIPTVPPTEPEGTPHDTLASDPADRNA
ncbi:MAG: cbb3-type cytochrome oxidase assembly protein CcoS [Proteobacteria bacterium]|nr:cbb3-type cytochrome oxidase assembly protein CcoS [Pseudomonadota bacterium]